jgi:twitching motility two-component system response regulator PilH
MSRDKATILYIYDRLNPKNGRRLLLQQHGYQVLEATNSLDGIHMFTSQTVDAVILDCHTPGTSSDAVASQIKHINAKVPIVLLSTLEAQTDTKFESTDLHLSKSQSPTFFVSALQHLLDGPSKPFFSRWLDNWRIRNQGASQ